MRRGTASIAANPVLIGAATTLVVIVAVFLAYNANNGLPFVPTYDLKTVVPNAANLVEGNEVRLGGSRVGVVDQIRPVRRPDGSTEAELSMKLETSIQPLPDDSTVLVRPRSALGLKYVELTKGTSGRGFETGAMIPVQQATPDAVEIDEVLAMFDEPTRAGSRESLNEFGGALAGRGTALNDAFGSLPILLPNLESVMQNLSTDETDLRGFVRGLGQAAGEAAPVAEEQAALFRNLDTTFTALAAVDDEIQDTISTGPDAFRAAIDSLPPQRPFLANAAGLFRELRPGVRDLRLASVDLAEAFTIGQPVLRRSVALNERLKPTFRAVQAFADDPLTSLGINGLRNSANILAPTLRHFKPVQTRCNYVTLWFRNIASLLSEGNGNGTWQRFIVVSAPNGENNEGGPASAPANGELGNGQSIPSGPSAQAAQVPSAPAGGDPGANFLHTNPYPNTASPGQTQECEAGNEDWLPGRTVIGNQPGNQGLATEETTVIRDAPGSLPLSEDAKTPVGEDGA